MFRKLIASTIIIASLTTSSVLAYPVKQGNHIANAASQGGHNNRFYKRVSRDSREDFEKDPLKALQKKKEKIQTLLKEGKISQEKAEKIIQRIDSLSDEIKAFNKLSVADKKKALIQNCKTRLDELVKEGKLDQMKADEIMNNYTKRINAWDGTGYPIFRDRAHKKHN